MSDSCIFTKGCNNPFNFPLLKPDWLHSKRSPSFAIPPEFQDYLEPRRIVDTRTDIEILDSLQKYYKPVTSEKNVWAFWRSGLMSMPGWCRRNVVNWVRLLGPSWQVRVLDALPESPNYMLKYVSAATLNDAMAADTRDEAYFGSHITDLLPGACLVTHGGVFMDVRCILVGDLDRICWNQLQDPESAFQVAVPWIYGMTVANHFVASRKGDPFILRWHELLVHLWKNHKNHEGLIEDPLVSFAKEISYDDLHASKLHRGLEVPTQTVMECVTQACWMRICMLEDIGDGFSGVDYWQNRVLIWDSLQEDMGAEALLGFPSSGQKVFDRLSVRTDSDQSSREYQAASKLVWRLLLKSKMQKIANGKSLTDSVSLGALWAENPGTDCKSGTFSELLRYGSVHFAQTNREIEYVQAPKPPKTLKKGLLEP